MAKIDFVLELRNYCLKSISTIFIYVFLSAFCVSRRRTLQRRVEEAQMPVEEQEEMLRSLERRETEFMRLQRRKVGIDDFEQLTVIGKGAFGEVYANAICNNLNFIAEFSFVRTIAYLLVH